MHTPSLPPPAAGAAVKPHRGIAATLCLAMLAGCGTPSTSLVVPGPLAATPLPRPTNLERVRTGSIYQAGQQTGWLLSGERRPRSVGDTLKVAISETLEASSQAQTETRRDSALAQKGPGGKAGPALLSSVLNLDADASGSDAFKGKGSTSNTTRFVGSLAVTVINVLPNGHLVVAGDRTVALNSGINVLRFSGIVNPRDIAVGNIVASADTVNARIELVGEGDMNEAASRSWIQRVLASSLAFW